MDTHPLVKLVIDGRWVGYWRYRGGEWDVVPRIAGSGPAALPIIMGASLLWQMYQYNNMPETPVSGGSQHGGPGQQIYDQDGNLVSESVWVADSSAYGGHWEQRSYGDVGKRPTPPGDRPVAPNPRDFDVYSGGEESDSGVPDAGSPNNWGGGPEQTLVTPGEDTAEYRQAVIAHEQSTATWEQGNTEYQQQLADWEAKKKRYDDQQTLLADLETKSLEVLNTSIDDIASKYREAEVAFRDEQAAKLTPQITEQEQRIREQGLATGQTGSRAEVDRLGALDKAEAEANLEINRNATLYKYALANQEYSRAMGVYDAVGRTRNAATAEAIQKAGLADQFVLESQRSAIAGSAASQNSAWLQYQADLAKHQGLTSGVSNTLNGLAFLYGFTGGGGGGTGGGSSVTPTTPSGGYSNPYTSIAPYNFTGR